MEHRDVHAYVRDLLDRLREVYSTVQRVKMETDQRHEDAAAAAPDPDIKVMPNPGEAADGPAAPGDGTEDGNDVPKTPGVSLHAKPPCEATIRGLRGQEK